MMTPSCGRHDDNGRDKHQPHQAAWQKHQQHKANLPYTPQK
jgi:hypothetical protein